MRLTATTQCKWTADARLKLLKLHLSAIHWHCVVAGQTLKQTHSSLAVDLMEQWWVRYVNAEMLQTHAQRHVIWSVHRRAMTCITCHQPVQCCDTHHHPASATHVTVINRWVTEQFNASSFNRQHTAATVTVSVSAAGSYLLNCYYLIFCVIWLSISNTVVTILNFQHLLVAPLQLTAH